MYLRRGMTIDRKVSKAESGCGRGWGQDGADGTQVGSGVVPTGT